jgi:hypothetical protein
LYVKECSRQLNYFHRRLEEYVNNISTLFHTCRRARDYINLPSPYRYFAAENILIVTTAYSTFLHFNCSNLNKLIIINTYYTKFYFFVLNELLFYYNESRASVESLNSCFITQLLRMLKKMIDARRISRKYNVAHNRLCGKT